MTESPANPLLEAFFRDGSLRNVDVEGTRTQFEELAKRLAATGWALSMDSAPLHAKTLPAWFPRDDTSFRISATRSGCVLNLWSWDPAADKGFFSEVDLAPREVDKHNIIFVEEALMTLANVVGRPMHLTLEGMPKAVFATAHPGGNVVVDLEMCTAWKRPLGR